MADSKQTRACWYRSVVALAGLVANAVLGWWWADPLAVLANRTMIETFAARVPTLMTPEPSPLGTERLPKHVR